MPLLKGKKNIGKNIETEEAHGKPRDQATAIALRVAGVPKKGAKDAHGVSRAEAEECVCMAIEQLRGQPITERSVDAQVQGIAPDYATAMGVNPDDLYDACTKVIPTMIKKHAKDSVPTYELTPVPMPSGERDQPELAPVPVGDGEDNPHKFESMPGNKPGRPCNRCLERKDHANHDPRRIAEYEALKKKAAGSKKIGLVALDAAKDAVDPGLVRGCEEQIERIKADIANEKKEKFGSKKIMAELKSELAKYEAKLARLKSSAKDAVLCPGCGRPAEGATCPYCGEHLDARRSAGKDEQSNWYELKIANAKEAEVATEHGDGTQFKPGDVVLHNAYLGKYKRIPAKDALTPVPVGDDFEEEGWDPVGSNPNRRPAPWEDVRTNDNAITYIVTMKKPGIRVTFTKVVQASSEEEAKKIAERENSPAIAMSAYAKGTDALTPVPVDDEVEMKYAPRPKPQKPLTSVVAPTPEDMERIFGRKPTKKDLARTFGKDAAVEYFIEIASQPAWSGSSEQEALRMYERFVSDSKAGRGKADGESVDLYKGDTLIKSYSPTKKRNKDAQVKPVPVTRVNPAPVVKTVPVSKAKHVKDESPDAVVTAVKRMMREAHIPLTEIDFSTVRKAAVKGSTAQQIFESIKEEYDEPPAKDSLESEAVQADRRDMRVIQEELKDGQLTLEQIAQKYGFPLQFVKDVATGKFKPSLSRYKATDADGQLAELRRKVDDLRKQILRVGPDDSHLDTNDPRVDALHRQLAEAEYALEAHEAALGRAADGRSRAKDGASPVATLIAAQLLEIQGKRRVALDAYRTVEKEARRTGDRALANDARAGVDECQRRLAGSGHYAYGDSFYAHPQAGRSRAYDTAATALRIALERTRAGEDVAVSGNRVGPRSKASRAKDSVNPNADRPPRFMPGDRVYAINGLHRGEGVVVAVSVGGTVRPGYTVKFDGGKFTTVESNLFPAKDALTPVPVEGPPVLCGGAVEGRDEHLGWKKLVGKLRREGHSKESAEKIAGKINAEKYGHGKDAESHEAHIRQLREELRRAPGNTTAKAELKRLEAKDERKPKWQPDSPDQAKLEGLHRELNGAGYKYDYSSGTGKGEITHVYRAPLGTMTGAYLFERKNGNHGKGRAGDTRRRAAN